MRIIVSYETILSLYGPNSDVGFTIALFIMAGNAQFCPKKYEASFIWMGALHILQFLAVFKLRKKFTKLQPFSLKMVLGCNRFLHCMHAPRTTRTRFACTHARIPILWWSHFTPAPFQIILFLTIFQQFLGCSKTEQDVLKQERTF